MSALLIAVAIVSVFATLMWLIYRSTEADRPAPWLIAIAAVVVGIIWVAMTAAQREDESGPCLRHETRYVLVNKVMTPYRACIERGEWVKP